MIKTRLIVTIVSFILFFTEINGQEDVSTKCSIEIVANTKNNINTLTESQLLLFLKSFDSTCQTNVEYSQFSNETLFEVLQSQTELIINCIEKYHSQIQYDIIISKLSNPIHDGFDLVKIKEKVEQIDEETKTKRNILESLDKAIGSYSR